MNTTIKQLLDINKITKQEYDILFEDKANWLEIRYTNINIDRLTDSENNNLVENIFKIEDYTNALNKVIKLQSTCEKIDLSYVQFINYEFLENYNTIFSFSNCKFYGTTSFMNSAFHKKVYFDNAIFYGEVEFSHSKFKMGGSFIRTIFKDNTFFNDSIYNEEMYFKGAYFEKIVDFSNSVFKRLELTNTYLNLSNFNGIKSFAYFSFTSIFSNKETARIIKSHYEKHNNIIEANKYFVTEQKKYYEELNWKKNFEKKFVVGLSKTISNHQYSWLKVLLWIIIFSFLVLCFHDGLPSLSIKDIGNIPNRAVELINPLNIFKKDYNLYKGHEFWAMIVRIITLYLFYQFIVAFRQNTRRK